MILSDNDFRCLYSHSNVCQKQPSRGVIKKRCPENMQQIYRRKLKPKCDFNKVVLHGYGCSPVNLLYIFRTPFLGTHLWTAASEVPQSFVSVSV